MVMSLWPRFLAHRVGVVNKLDRRRVLSTTRSTCRGETFEVQSLWQISIGKCPNFPRYQNFLITHVEESLHAKTDSIRLLVSIQYQLVTDRRTDGQTHYGSIYRGNKNYFKFRHENYNFNERIPAT